jgi:REP element-mobilizing transposase RayT
MFIDNDRESRNHSRIQVRRQPQLSLLLRSPRRWGGARVGAGRKPGLNPRLRHVSRARFRSPLPAHVTIKMRSDVPSLRTVPIIREIERTFARGCARPGFRLVHYSLQDNHAHLIVEARDRDALGRGMKAIGARLGLAVNRMAKRSGRVLADRYHSRLLSTPKEVHHALCYVLLNARRHAPRRSAARDRVRLDPASSGRWFDGWKRQVPGAREPAATHFDHPPVARAKTWLLTVGWRRHGLLDPADVPG